MVIRSISVPDVHLKLTKQDVVTEQRAVLMVVVVPEIVVRHVQIMVEAQLVAVKVHLLAVHMGLNHLVQTATEIQDILVNLAQTMAEAQLVAVKVRDLLVHMV